MSINTILFRLVLVFPSSRIFLLVVSVFCYLVSIFLHFFSFFSSVFSFAFYLPVPPINTHRHTRERNSFCCRHLRLSPCHIVVVVVVVVVVVIVVVVVVVVVADDDDDNNNNNNNNNDCRPLLPINSSRAN